MAEWATIESSRAELRRIFVARPDEQGYPIPLGTRLRYGQYLTRPEIFPMAIGALTAQVMFTVHSWREVWTAEMVAAAVLLALYVQLFNIVNCLADRWEDAHYKSRYAIAIEALGVPNVARRIYLRSAIISALLVYLVVATRHLDLVLIVGVGLVLAFQYSVPPWRLKGRGVWQIPTLYVMDMVVTGLVVLRATDRPIELVTVTAILGLGLTINGLFVANTAEDLPEDEQYSINTSVRALGLSAALWVGIAQVSVGGAMVLWSSWSRVEAGWAWGYVVYAAALLAALGYLFRLLIGTRGATQDEAMAIIRPAAKAFPLMITVMAWGTDVLAGCVFGSR